MISLCMWHLQLLNKAISRPIPQEKGRIIENTFMIYELQECILKLSEQITRCVKG